ncbi:MAG: hypothetical protein RLZZ461_1413, partial [Planctomycetota bacterium]
MFEGLDGSKDRGIVGAADPGERLGTEGERCTPKRDGRGVLEGEHVDEIENADQRDVGIAVGMSDRGT